MKQKKSHSKIENSDIKKEFPDLISLMSSKEVKKNSKKKESLKKRNRFYKQVFENKENNGEDIS